MLGTRFALVVHCNGLDEISTTGITKILELKSGQINRMELNPEDFGISVSSIDKLKVTDAKTSAKIVRDILENKLTGVGRDMIVLNASAAIITGGLAEDFNSALRLANESIDNGGALTCLEKMIEVSNKA